MLKRRGEGDSLVILGIFVVFLLTVAFFAWPSLNVYRRGKAGEAELRQAESNRKIAVLEAQAKMESAKLFAQAEVERAKGVAEANKIIGSSLSGNDAYLRYLWIQNLGTGNREVVYIPTEANLPIFLESGKTGHELAPPTK